MNTATLFAFPIVAIMAVFSLGFFPALYTKALEIRTTDESLAVTCTTDSDGGCSFALAGEHALPDLSGATVTETSPGSVDRTSVGTLGVLRVTVSMAGLSALTGYNFTVDYLAPRTDLPPVIGGLLNILPYAMVLGTWGLLFVVVVLAWTTRRG